MEKENPFLFIRGPSGAPIRFGLDLKNAEFRVKVIEWIKAGGGTVDNSDRNDCRIKLLEKECRVLPHRDDGDVFSANYIEDCVKENKFHLATDTLEMKHMKATKNNTCNSQF